LIWKEIDIKSGLKMKWCFIFALLLTAACAQHDNNKSDLTHNPKGIDSRELEQIMAQSLPELGEIMNVIQLHHAKLWFAGLYKNWKLAEYEIGELREMFDTAKLKDRPEVKDVPMIYPMIDSISASVKQKSFKSFKNNFELLTKTCNACHQQHNYEFNVITIPTIPPVVNQDFNPHN
jgi:hypothetical protein